MNTTFDTETCVAIIAVAISVSVGLNIYNSIERNELNELRNNIGEFNESLERSQERDKYMFLESLQELKNESMNHQLYKLFSDRLLRNRNSESIMPHVSYLLCVQRVHLLLISQYDSDPHGINCVSPELEKLLDSKGLHNADLLCSIFLTYIEANCYYMGQMFDAAIYNFKKVLKLIERIDINNIESKTIKTEMEMYLHNAIGISYYYCKKYEKAIEEYRRIEELTKNRGDVKKYSQYECVYFRNYGACYERNSISKTADEAKIDLKQAIDKYNLAIDNWNSISKDYKVFGSSRKVVGLTETR